jgi:hypothetical protein
MQTARAMIRPMIAILMGCLGTIAIFGILLSLAWFGGGDTPSSKLGLCIMSAAIAFWSGGFIVAWLAGSRSQAFPAVFGLVLGALSFGYILGINLLVLPMASASAFLAGLGAWLFHSVVRARMQSAHLDSA